MYPDQKTLEEICRKVVETAHPLRIILFGSAARGEMHQDSDVDILVLIPEGTHRLHTAMDLHQAMLDVNAEVAVDFVVAWPSQLEKHGASPYLIYRDVLREGMELYNAAA